VSNPSSIEQAARLAIVRGALEAGAPGAPPGVDASDTPVASQTRASPDSKQERVQRYRGIACARSKGLVQLGLARCVAQAHGIDRQRVVMPWRCLGV